MLIESIVELVYFMRGAIGYEEMMLRTPAERDLIRNFITKRLESQKDSPYPVY
jgi:hypothetical protein